MTDHRFIEPPRMTFMESMRSLLSTARATIQAGPQGIASPQLYESRLKICEVCPKREAVGILWKCGVCNCFLHLKAGTTVSVCPWYKWPGDERFKPRDFHTNL
jgi:Family of unknown function (DUF6171)